MSEYLRRLPIGQRMSTAPLTGNELWPFDSDLETVALAEPMLPEPAREGEGGVECGNCTARAGWDAWRDERWVMRIPPTPTGLPIVAVLMSRAHHDLETLPHELAVELGPMIQRVARALAALPDVGRIHVNRWGDGSEHFHVWFLPRPRGMLQLRGALLAAWDDLLPKVPQAEWDATGSLSRGQWQLTAESSSSSPSFDGVCTSHSAVARRTAARIGPWPRTLPPRSASRYPTASPPSH